MITLEISCQSAPELTSSTFRYTFDQDEVLAGRDEAVDVRLPHPSVSLVHLRLRRKQGRLFALDTGSTNGTYVNGRRLAPGKAVALAEQSRIQIGPFLLRLTPAAAAPQLTGPQDTAAFARQMVLELLGAVQGGCHRYLEVEAGPQQGERLELPALSPPLRIGRGEECQLRLRDADVSRQHLELQVQGDEVQVQDLGSKNGFEVNGSRVLGERLLQDSDKVRLGGTTLVFCNNAQRYLRNLQQPELDPACAALLEGGPDPLSAAAQEPAGSDSAQPLVAGAARGGEQQQTSGSLPRSAWASGALGLVAVVLVLVALAAIVYVLV